jgi:hypothetical protein
MFGVEARRATLDMHNMGSNLFSLEWCLNVAQVGNIGHDDDIHVFEN